MAQCAHCVPSLTEGELVLLFCFGQAFLIEEGCYVVREKRGDEIGILSETKSCCVRGELRQSS